MAIRAPPSLLINRGIGIAVATGRESPDGSMSLIGLLPSLGLFGANIGGASLGDCCFQGQTSLTGRCKSNILKLNVFEPTGA